LKQRINKLTTILNEHQIDAAIISEKNNIRYYSGFTSEDAILLIHKSACYLITDFRYIEQAQLQSPEFNIVDAPGPKTGPFIRKACMELGAKRICFDGDTISYSTYISFKEALLPLELIPDKGIPSGLRLLKTEEEINHIRNAAALADKGFQHILNYIRPGVSEKEIALELELFLRNNGSEGLAFPIIAASGKNGALPHAEPTNKKLNKGEFITFDFGCKISGYCSDMTRTVSLGEPENEMRKIYEITLEAQKLALKIIKPGLTGIEVDKQAREYIAEKGYGEYFGHGLGHGVGLNVHEAPKLSTSGENVLQPGMVVSVEPGIYLPGKGGVRIEDLVVITENGYYNLVSSRKDLIIL
jgi:Xaa-Pro aminopeptidase